MRTQLAFVAMLALGFLVGCAAEPVTDSQSTSRPTAEPSKVPAPAVATPEAHKVENVDAAGAAKLLAENDEAIILDIRTPGEFQRGHLKGAVNIDYRAEDYAEKLGGLDKEKTYLVH